MYIVSVECFDVAFKTCVTMSLHHALLECAYWRGKNHRVHLRKVGA